MSEPLEFQLQVTSEDEDREEIDQFTRDLLRDLRDQAKVESAEFVHEGTAPAGTKGMDAETVLLAVKVSVEALGLVLHFLQRRMGSRSGSIRLMAPEGSSAPTSGSIQLAGNPVELARLLQAMAPSGTTRSH